MSNQTRALAEQGELARCCFVKDGWRQLVLPEDLLPPTLIQAFKAACTEQVPVARAYVTAELIETVDEMRRAACPGGLIASFVLALVFQQLGNLGDAVERLEVLIDEEPHALVINTLAGLHHTQGQVSRALALRQQAARMAPDCQEIQSHLARDLISAGRLREGIVLMRNIIDQGQVCANLHSSLLLSLHYLPHITQTRLLEEHQHWARRYAPGKPTQTAHSPDPDPNRRLRIGYVSADLRRHSVAYSFEPILDGRCTESAKLYAYANVQTPDEVTHRLAGKFDAFRRIFGKSDRVVGELIKQDRIDILVAVAGHSGHHRLTLFADKPAPIQVDFQGINTTGLPQMDYRFTDRYLNPTDLEQGYQERLVFVPGGVHCFRPPKSTPDIEALPALSRGTVTFGSFNQFPKINDVVVSLWSQVLKACPGSQLLVKCRTGTDQDIQQSLWARFEAQGISADRIDIVGWLPIGEHWQSYHEVDIALDTYPFNGCTTTMEALWMGVPVLSLAGRIYVSRMGLSLLGSLGLESFVATSADQFVAKAAALAANPRALAKLRASMRQRMLASPLCDAHRFARELEAAYRWMWHQWCGASRI